MTSTVFVSKKEVVCLLKIIRQPETSSYKITKSDKVLDETDVIYRVGQIEKAYGLLRQGSTTLGTCAESGTNAT